MVALGCSRLPLSGFRFDDPQNAGTATSGEPASSPWTRTNISTSGGWLGSTRFQDAVEGTPGLPAGWIEAVSPAGKPYWYDDATLEATWERPAVPTPTAGALTTPVSRPALPGASADAGDSGIPTIAGEHSYNSASPRSAPFREGLIKHGVALCRDVLLEQVILIRYPAFLGLYLHSTK